MASIGEVRQEYLGAKDELESGAATTHEAREMTDTTSLTRSLELLDEVRELIAVRKETISQAAGHMAIGAEHANQAHAIITTTTRTTSQSTHQELAAKVHALGQDTESVSGNYAHMASEEDDFMTFIANARDAVQEMIEQHRTVDERAAGIEARYRDCADEVETNAAKF